MTRSVDLFLASDEPVEELAHTIAAATGLEAAARPGGQAWDLSDRDLLAVLHRHVYMDDVELPLGRYRYAVTMTTSVAGHLGSSREVSLLRMVAASVPTLPSLLVLDLQYRFAGTAASAGSSAPGAPSDPTAPDLTAPDATFPDATVPDVVLPGDPHRSPVVASAPPVGGLLSPPPDGPPASASPVTSGGAEVPAGASPAPTGDGVAQS